MTERLTGWRRARKKPVESEHFRAGFAAAEGGLTPKRKADAVLKITTDRLGVNLNHNSAARH